MTQPLLACGPYFEPSGLIASFAIFLLFKPLSYYAFVRAFRYRVCRAIPMTTRQAIGLAALRAGLGLVLVGGGAWALTFWEQLPSGFYIWVYMYAARLFAWWIVGKVAGFEAGA